MAQSIYGTFVNAWELSSASPGALPSGVTGTSLYGLTTTAKETAIGNWTITGSVPSSLQFNGPTIAGLINWTEFNALTAQQQSNLLALCNNPGPLPGGSSNAAFLPIGMLLAYFALNSVTIANLTAYANGLPQLWLNAPVAEGGAGLSDPVSEIPEIVVATGVS